MYGAPNLGTGVCVNEPVKQDYSSSQDEKIGTIEGIGSIIYSRNDYVQSYEGKFVWDNMHGYGEYQWQPPKYKHEGQFYVNKKEGYGRSSYPSGGYFEGLYRNDQRFGPGVYTDSAGFQDVGIWVASKLIRLSRIFEPDHVMPRLAITDEDKIRMLKYRQVIHLEKDKIKHVAKSLLESLTHSRNYDKSVLARAGELYNCLCRDDRAPAFDKPRYDEIFFGLESDQLTIDVLMTEEEIQQKIAAEKGETPEVEGLPSIVAPQINESKMIHEMYNLSDNQIHEQYFGKISQQIVNVEIFEDEKAEEEPDYCGIKEIDLDSMNDTLLKGNHEEQWNIFQSSTIRIPQDSPEDSDLNYSNEENLQRLDETSAMEKDFDEFGRRKVKDAQHTKKVVVTDLMAWNNSPILIELLKHVFKHRNFEKKLSFDISKILAGRRGLFRQEGTHEKAALELLEACSSGFQNIIPKLIARQNLDVDVADSRGNTGLLLAAAKDRAEVIDILLNLGANVDSVNDECLTPLSLCLLRLLALIHNVTNWSKAFLPKTIITKSRIDAEPTVFKNLEQWHGRISYESLVQQPPKQMDSNPLQSKNSSGFNSKDIPVKGESGIDKDAMNAELGIVLYKLNEARVRAEPEVTEKLGQYPEMQNNYDTGNSANEHKTQAQKYIFDMSPIIGASSAWKKFKNDKTKNSNTNKKVKTKTDKKQKERIISSRSEDSEQMQDINNSEVSEKKEKICTTISKLLQRGADPNFAQVPYPIIIMAIFTRMPSLVSELLEHDANPDTTLSKDDHSFTPLLILAVLQPAHEHALIAEALLKAKADPSIRTDPDYRTDLMERLNRNRLSEFIENSEGVTALHLLAIRPDMDTDINGYLGELIRVIHQYGYIKKSDLYYGHSPLSLAIFEGNLTGVKAFLKTTCVNVNEQLGRDLGNAMLMLESRILQELLPADLLQEILELLLEYGGCPFASVGVLGEYYNQIEYGRKELTKISHPPENKPEVKQKKKLKSKGSKSSKLSDTINFTKSMDFIEKIAKEKLIERIKANFVRDLMDSPIMLLSPERRIEFLKDPIFKDALAWMTGEDVAIVMKTMNYNRVDARELVRLFVTACLMSRQETLSDIHTLIRNETERIINNVMPLAKSKEQIVTAVDFKIDKHIGRRETKIFERIMACQPESSLEDNRFNVCFECLTVHGKVLILCPKCKRVYFCSQECNSKCTTQETNLHHCPVFYQKEWMRLEKIATTIGLDPMSYMLRRFADPEVYMDLEKKTGPYNEQRGKKSSKNQTYANLLKCKDQDSTAYREYGADQVGKENGNQHEYKDESRDASKGEQLKRNGILKTEDDDNDIQSNRQKKSRTIDREDKKAGVSDMKKNKKKTDNLVDSKEDLEHNIKSKHTDKIGNRFNTNADQKDTFDKTKSKKGIKKSHVNGDENDEKAAESDSKWKNGKKNRYRHTINGVEESGGNKVKLRGDKYGDRIEENDSKSSNLRKGKMKGNELDENKATTNPKYKSRDDRWRGKKGGERLTNFRKKEDDDVKDDLRRKHGAKHDKQIWRNEINKTTRKRESNTSNERYRKNQHYVKTNVPEKYLDWLLRVSRSAGDNLNIDMLLLPYVVFAQGDTYFRILPADQDPKFAGNYSLI